MQNHVHILVKSFYVTQVNYKLLTKICLFISFEARAIKQ